MTTNIFIITAYCLCSHCCPPSNSELAANGKPPVAGVTCAAPRFIPLGSKLQIEGIGERIVTDRLHKRYTNRVDIFMDSHKAAKQFGIKTNKVIIQ